MKEGFLETDLSGLLDSASSFEPAAESDSERSVLLGRFGSSRRNRLGMATLSLGGPLPPAIFRNRVASRVGSGKASNSSRPGRLWFRSALTSMVTTSG